jgi:hypothetical protein
MQDQSTSTVNAFVVLLKNYALFKLISQCRIKYTLKNLLYRGMVWADFKRLSHEMNYAKPLVLIYNKQPCTYIYCTVHYNLSDI